MVLLREERKEAQASALKLHGSPAACAQSRVSEAEGRGRERGFRVLQRNLGFFSEFRVFLRVWDLKRSLGFF
jgi:hypothetical protein